MTSVNGLQRHVFGFPGHPPARLCVRLGLDIAEWPVSSLYYGSFSVLAAPTPARPVEVATFVVSEQVSITVRLRPASAIRAATQTFYIDHDDARELMPLVHALVDASAEAWLRDAPTPPRVC